MGWGEKFTEGQKVTISTHYGCPEAVSTVSKVGARKMTLADGSEWTSDGTRSWGCSDRWYTGRSVSAHTEADDEKIFRLKAVRLLVNMKWDQLDANTLRDVIDNIPAQFIGRAI